MASEWSPERIIAAVAATAFLLATDPGWLLPRLRAKAGDDALVVAALRLRRRRVAWLIAGFICAFASAATKFLHNPVTWIVFVGAVAGLLGAVIATSRLRRLDGRRGHAA